MQSAVGRVQLRKLPQWLSIRRKYAQILTKQFATLPSLRVTVPPKHIEHAYYKYYAFVRPEALRSEWSRDRIIEAVKAEGIPCFSGSSVSYTHLTKQEIARICAPAFYA